MQDSVERILAKRRQRLGTTSPSTNVSFSSSDPSRTPAGLGAEDRGASSRSYFARRAEEVQRSSADAVIRPLQREFVPYIDTTINESDLRPQEAPEACAAKLAARVPSQKQKRIDQLNALRRQKLYDELKESQRMMGRTAPALSKSDEQFDQDIQQLISAVNNQIELQLESQPPQDVLQQTDMQPPLTCPQQNVFISKSQTGAAPQPQQQIVLLKQSVGPTQSKPDSGTMRIFSNLNQQMFTNNDHKDTGAIHVAEATEYLANLSHSLSSITKQKNNVFLQKCLQYDENMVDPSADNGTCQYNLQEQLYDLDQVDQTCDGPKSTLVRFMSTRQFGETPMSIDSEPDAPRKQSLLLQAQSQQPNIDFEQLEQRLDRSVSMVPNESPSRVSQNSAGQHSSRIKQSTLHDGREVQHTQMVVNEGAQAGCVDDFGSIQEDIDNVIGQHQTLQQTVQSSLFLPVKYQIQDRGPTEGKNPTRMTQGELDSFINQQIENNSINRRIMDCFGPTRGDNRSSIQKQTARLLNVDAINQLIE